MENKDDIKVSVICITYNHEKFLKECLDSMVCQKTNFPFEIIVHDDKSSDKTVEIIKEYENKYPDLIVPILEKENQYSKGRSIIEECALPYARGKYVAICEGDDKWCDENKLQKQYDFMENHPDYVACYHNTILHDLSEKKQDELMNDVNNIVDIEVGDLFRNKVHTSSLFALREVYKKLDFGKKCWFGDFVILSSIFLRGKLAILPDIMSIYNCNNNDGVMNRINKKSPQEQIELSNVRIEYLKNYNDYTNGKFKDLILNDISEIFVYNIYDNKLLLSKNNKEYNQIRKELLKSEEYKRCLKMRRLQGKIKLFVKYHLPRKIFIKYRGK